MDFVHNKQYAVAGSGNELAALDNYSKGKKKKNTMNT